MSRSRFSVFVLAAGLALAAPGVASACLTPLPMTARERAERDQALQERLWSQAELVFTAAVTDVEAQPFLTEPGGVPVPGSIDNEHIRVVLSPLQVLKGRQDALPPTLEFSDIYVSCTPYGLQSARVGDVFVVYAANPARNTAAGALPLEDIRHRATRAALRAARR